MTARRWGAAAALVLLVSLGGVALFRAFARREAPVLACRFSRGQQLGFTLRTVIDSGSPTGPRGQQTLSARMRWRVLQPSDPGEWLIAGVLTDLSSNVPAGAAGYADAADIPFLFKLAIDCRFADFGFPAAMKLEGREKIRGLLESMEVLLAADPKKPTWLRAHKDGTGTYTAMYAPLDPARDDEGAPRFSRQRGPYLSLRHPGGALRIDVQLTAADARFTLDRGGAWLKAFDGSQSLRFLNDGKPMLDVRSATYLRRDDTGAPFPADESQLLAARFTFGEAALRRDPRQAQQLDLPPPDPRLRTVNLADALTGFLDRLHKGDNTALQDAVAALVQYLRARPEAARELLERLRKGDLPDDAQAAAFLALERAGTKEAQDVLVEALTDPRMRATNRMRAAVALPDVASPGKGAVDALIDTARGHRQDQDADVSHTALLAMGAMSQRLGESQPAVADRLRKELRAELSTAREAGDVAAALDAIGNSGDAGFADQLRTAAADEASVVRLHAARALGKMDAGVRDPTLSAWLAREADPAVRRAIADALLDGAGREEAGRAADPVIEMAIARLPVEPDARVRAGLINLLGTAASANTAAKAALIAHFHREQLPELLTLIGRYCSAAELR